jgi:integrase
VWRLFFGFLTREGLRREDAATLEWSNLSLGLDGAAGHLVLDVTKNGRGASWALDPGTTEALRRWQRMCPPGPWVFPAEALPRYRRRRRGQALHVDHAGEILRRALEKAGVDREKLFQSGNNRLQLRAHDLRATFVTLALACGRSEDWVMQRTGHSSSVMLSRYRREATTAQELGLGWLAPLHLSIPELATR